MPGLVLDCSVAVAWCFEDEATAELDALLPLLRDEGAVVPAIWHLEVANVLLMAERRGRISESGMPAHLRLLAELPIVTDTASAERVLRDVLPLARTHRLTAYDASYLELAARLNLKLATTDRALRAAAQAIGVAVLP